MYLEPEDESEPELTLVQVEQADVSEMIQHGHVRCLHAHST